MERSYDIYSRLLGERIVFVGTAIDDKLANVLMANLLYLQHQDPRADIHFHINSPGGSVTSSLAIHDTLRFVKCDVATYGIGEVSGTALLLLAAGTKGKRFVLPHARASFADVWTGKANGDASDLEIQKEETVKLRRALVDLFHKYAGLSKERIESEFGSGRGFSAEETVKLGLADRIIEKSELP